MSICLHVMPCSVGFPCQAMNEYDVYICPCVPLDVIKILPASSRSLVKAEG